MARISTHAHSEVASGVYEALTVVSPNSVHSQSKQLQGSRQISWSFKLDSAMEDQVINLPETDRDNEEHTGRTTPPPADRTRATVDALSEDNLKSLAEQVARFLADSHPKGSPLPTHSGKFCSQDIFLPSLYCPSTPRSMNPSPYG